MDDGKMKINDIAQVALEFVVGFVCTILFLALTVQIFVWFGNNIVKRNKAYEDSRGGQVMTGIGLYENTPVPPTDFYDQSQHQLDIRYIKR